MGTRDGTDHAELAGVTLRRVCGGLRHREACQPDDHGRENHRRDDAPPYLHPDEHTRTIGRS
jgi:hypothetical protein